MSLETFKRSQTGARIAPILADPSGVSAMERKSRDGRPAVEAVGARIAQVVGKLDDEERKLVGRWVKQVLIPRGWVPLKKGRVAPGNLFSRGTIYRRLGSVKSEVQSLGAAERVAAARAILAQSPFEIMTSEELIAERRREFERGE
jgi:hypothetical protein